MTFAPRTPRVVTLRRALLRALAIEHRAVQIQREALRGRRHQPQQPAPERTEKRLDPALRKAPEKAQHRIFAGEPADARHRLQRVAGCLRARPSGCLWQAVSLRSAVKTPAAAVRKTRRADEVRKQKRRESLRRRDRIGRSVAPRHRRRRCRLAKSRMAQPRDETGQPAKERDRLGRGPQSDLAPAAKRGKIHHLVVCGRRCVVFVHTNQSRPPSRPKRLLPSRSLG